MNKERLRRSTATASSGPQSTLKADGEKSWHDVVRRRIMFNRTEIRQEESATLGAHPFLANAHPA